jgi:iron complex transport system substrate-binding protein
LRRVLATAVALALVLPGAHAVAAPPGRILSLDQCADQYVLALAPDAELFLSPRADDPDAWLRRAAAGRQRVRPTLEAALAVRPEVVVRTWGGDPRLLRAMESRGVRVVQIGDATEMSDVRRNTRDVATALGRPDAGERLVQRMDRTLAVSSSGQGSRGSALYLTAGGFTAGTGTLVDAVLRAAGFANAAGLAGFGPISVERIALRPPSRFVLGFFDQLRADWRGVGRHPVVRRAASGRVVADLPGAVLTCPAWFAADAAHMIATGSAR